MDSSDESKADIMKMVKELIEAADKADPDRPVNLIATGADEWPAGWADAIEELQAGLI